MVQDIDEGDAKKTHNEVLFFFFKMRKKITKMIQHIFNLNILNAAIQNNFLKVKELNLHTEDA